MRTSKRRVLVVDDDPDSRMVIAEALADEDDEVEVAAHGEEALDRLATSRPEVILLDLAMPHMDGWELPAQHQSRSDLAEFRGRGAP